MESLQEMFIPPRKAPRWFKQGFNGLLAIVLETFILSWYSLWLGLPKNFAAQLATLGLLILPNLLVLKLISRVKY